MTSKVSETFEVFMKRTRLFSSQLVGGLDIETEAEAIFGIELGFQLP